ncbi:MAG: RNA-binding protein [Pseudomonadales bacterium]|nr:RNA-binding protein [Pseudomonadales bacterium]
MHDKYPPRPTSTLQVTDKNHAEISSARIDKWLWAARFFKSRSIAHDAVTGGKTHLAGQRVKPSRAVRIGDTLQIRQGQDEKTVTITKLSEKRVSATLAALMYEETEESISKREHNKEQRKLLPNPLPSKKPNKKERRQIKGFRNSNRE